MIPFQPATSRKHKKGTDLQKVAELVYKAAGFLPKGCGSVYALSARANRTRARETHDCLTLAVATEDPETLCCPWCTRLLDRGEAARLRALRL